MDIRKIALQLAGKFPPYKPFARLDFMEYLEDIFGFKVDKLEFYWKQAREYEEEFYYLVLDFLDQRSQKDHGYKVNLDKLIVALELENQNISNLELGTYDNEEDFTKSFLVPFFQKLGYKEVRYTHGAEEFGKDILMRKKDLLDNWEYIAVQAKLGDVSGSASKKDKTLVDTLIQQAKDAFSMPFKLIDQISEVYPSKVFLAINGNFADNAVTKITTKLTTPSEKNNIHFLDKTKIENLLLEINK